MLKVCAYLLFKVDGCSFPMSATKKDRLPKLICETGQFTAWRSIQFSSSPQPRIEFFSLVDRWECINKLVCQHEYYSTTTQRSNWNVCSWRRSINHFKSNPPFAHMRKFPNKDVLNLDYCQQKGWSSGTNWHASQTKPNEWACCVKCRGRWRIVCCLSFKPISIKYGNKTC